MIFFSSLVFIQHILLISRTKTDRMKRKMAEIRKEGCGYTTQGLQPPAFGKAFAKITRQELSLKVLLIANKSDPVPQ